MTESQPINKKLQQLEEYITSLVDSLQRGEIPIGLRPVRSVFDRILIEELPQLQLPPQKFCDLYNDLPNVLDAYAIEVTLNSDSYGQNNSQQIIFDRFNNGNYWIVAITAKPLHYWLVPNPTRRIDLTRLNSLPFVFDWPDQEHITKQNTFKLIEPAEVVTLPTAPLSWKLLKRGSISTFLNADARAHQQEFRSISALNIEEIDRIVNHLKNEITESIMIELLSLKSKIKNIEDVQLEKNNEIITKIGAVEKEIQVINAAIMGTASFLGQQNSVNQQLNNQSQKSERTSEELRQKIEKLLQDKQQQVDEINIVKSLFNRLSQARVDNDDQIIRKAVQNINSFLEKQNSVNQSVSTHIQSIARKSENHEREMQTLVKGEQRQDNEIQVLRSILTSQNAQQLSYPKNLLGKKTFELSFSQEELDLLQEYNNSSLEVPTSLRDRAINVSINNETFDRLRKGDESNIAFQPSRHGNYLIVMRGGFRYLVPNRQQRIITQTYTATKAIYKCDGYNESYKDFRLVKPALVTEESLDCWKLSQQGILEFV